MPIYGDQQSQWTMNRAAYGDSAATMMASGGMGNGAGYNPEGPLATIGSMIRPVSYSPPARVNVGYYGQQLQQTGFFSSMAQMAGFNTTPRSTSSMEHSIRSSGDLGERVAGGLSSAGLTLGGMATGGIAAKVMGAGMVGGLGLSVAGMYGAQQVQQAVSQRRDITNYLENTSHRFVGAGSPMADTRMRGMSRDSRREVSEFIRSSDVSDKFMDTGDLTSILKQGTQMGMFNGTQDMDDFKKKFTDIKDAVKSVTRTLSQTLEEGMKTIKELKSIGVDPSGVRDIVSSADSYGRMSGRTGSEMMQIGLQGAEMFRGTGVSMDIGMQSTMMNVASVRAARDAGTLSTEAIAQAGGEESLGMRMNASSMSYAQSAQGRGMGAAFFSASGAGPGFNSGSFMSTMMGGGGDFTGLVKQAAGNLSSPAALIKYQANQEKFMSEMGNTFGGRGLHMAAIGAASSEASYLSKNTGASFEDSYRMTLKKQGKSYAEVETIIGESRGANKIYDSAMASAQKTKEVSQFEEAKQGMLFNRVSARAGDMIKGVADTLAAPISKFIDDTAESFTKFKEESLYGVRRANTKGVKTTGWEGLKGASKKGGLTDLDDEGGIGFDIFQGASAGETILNNLEKDGGKYAKSMGIDIKKMTPGEFHKLKQSGDLDDYVKLDRHAGTGQISLVKKDALEKANSIAARQSFTDEDMKTAEKRGLLDKVGGKSYTQTLSEHGDASSMEDLAQRMFGKSADKLSKTEIMKITKDTKGLSVAKFVEERNQQNRTGKKMGDAVSVKNVIDATKALDENVTDLTTGINDILGGDAMSGAELSRTEAGEISQLRKIKDGAARAAAADKIAVKISARVGGVASEKTLSESILRTVQMEGGSDGILGKIQSNSEAVGSIQNTRGARAMRNAVLSEASSMAGTAEDYDRIVAGADMLGNANSLEDMKGALAAGGDSFGSTTMGSASAGLVKSLEKMGKGDFSKDKAMAAVRAIPMSDDARKGLIAQISSGDLASSSAVSESVIKNFKESAASESSILSGGGGGAADGAGGKNSAEQFDVQMNINRQVLQAMSAISSKLGPAK